MSSKPTTKSAWSKTREFQNHHMDSSRWNDFAFRNDDIVIATWAKSGTTWMQQIVGQFVFDGASDIPVVSMSPWLDYRALPLEKVTAQLDAQTHRRFLKTHLPTDALHNSTAARYIYVARDGRDALWSWYEHHCAYQDFIYAALNESPGRIGAEFPRPDSDIVSYYDRWLEEDGYPAWPFFSNVQSWWNVRNLDNVLLLHFNDLKADLAGEMRRIARFLNVDIDEALWPTMVEHCTFDYMVTRADSLSDRLEKVFSNGGRSLVNKGVNARWRETLDSAASAKYEAIAARELSDECAAFLAGS